MAYLFAEDMPRPLYFVEQPETVAAAIGQMMVDGITPIVKTPEGDCWVLNLRRSTCVQISASTPNGFKHGEAVPMTLEPFQLPASDEPFHVL